MEDLSHYNAEGTNLRRAQLRMLDILVVLDRICKKYKIRYWLDYGTLLGAVRHGGFIPWDDDLDVSMMRKDYIRLMKILPKELPNNLVLQTQRSDKYYPLAFAKIRDKNSYMEEIERHAKSKDCGLYIDLFPQERMISVGIKDVVECFYGRAIRGSRGFHKTKRSIIIGYMLFPISWVLIGCGRVLNKLFAKEEIFPAFGVAFVCRGGQNVKNIFPCKPINFEGMQFMAPHNADSHLRGLYGDYMQIPPKEKRMVHSTHIEFLDDKA